LWLLCFFLSHSPSVARFSFRTAFLARLARLGFTWLSKVLCALRFIFIYGYLWIFSCGQSMAKGFDSELLSLIFEASLRASRKQPASENER